MNINLLLGIYIGIFLGLNLGIAVTYHSWLKEKNKRIDELDFKILRYEFESAKRLK